ncbi:MAG: hypothetical protein JW860_06040 [Sedimentisphaerales bacterium]|nr:hypothetical protein [Sedimentisphaerales bacterium]
MNEDNQSQLALGHSDVEDDSRALPRARNDVEITEQVYYGKPCYVLKDPTTLRYYRLRPPEYTIYQNLDGKRNMEDIQKILMERFPNEEFDAQSVMSFIIMLRGANLLRIKGDSDTEFLLQRKNILTRSIFQKIRQEYLFFRVPLFDPDKFLTSLNQKIGGFIYSRSSAIMLLVFLGGALGLVISNIDKFSQRQPIFDPYNMMYLAPAILLIKFIHEFGHGLTSKHFGSEVHEMGFLLLVFMPCFYCDVSDAWMLPEKKRRMWITAGGIVVEITLAGLAAYIWALTESKTVINQFALNVMLAASLNTLLFNGNPLLRYDGYYFVMDLLEIPNLKQKGTSYLWYLGQRYVLGMKNASMPIDVEGRTFTVAGFAICSTIYRWFIMIAITTMVWKFLDPYGWGVIGAIMALGCIYNALITPLWRFAKYMYNQWHFTEIKPATAIIILIVIAGAFYGLMLLPVEQSVEAQCVLRPAEMIPIYVNQPGFILAGNNQHWPREGQTVKQDDVLIRLSDPRLEYEVADLKLQIQQETLRLDQYRRGGYTEEEAQSQASLIALRKQFERSQQKLQHLTIKAPRDGILQIRTSEPLETLDGRFLPLQSELFSIYPLGRFEAVAAISHRDNGLIEKDQDVQIRLWSLPSEIIESKVKEKPPTPVLKMSSPVFSTIFGGGVATMPATNIEEAVEPADNTYELVIPIAGTDLRLRDGLVGKAKIIVQKRTLAGAFYLKLIRTLRQDIRL